MLMHLGEGRGGKLNRCAKTVRRKDARAGNPIARTDARMRRYPTVLHPRIEISKYR
jgi:hypothetical protein